MVLGNDSSCMHFLSRFSLVCTMHLYADTILNLMQIKREICTMKLVKHPNVVRLFEVRSQKVSTLHDVSLHLSRNMFVFILEICFFNFHAYNMTLFGWNYAFYLRWWEVKQEFSLFWNMLLAESFLKSL